MSYKKLSDLPRSLRHEFPRRAQEIYRAAYNRAYEVCMASEDLHDDQAIAETAHKAALLAVEMEYEKDEQGRWRRAPISEHMDKEKIPPPR
ncbi:MAG: ChaB family protein [Pseudomonadota bacterium]|nr:ChaB family protein [Pseudomonadota bacterium]